jgi:hypothetical protein
MRLVFLVAPEHTYHCSPIRPLLVRPPVGLPANLPTRPLGRLEHIPARVRRRLAAGSGCGGNAPEAAPAGSGVAWRREPAPAWSDYRLHPGRRDPVLQAARLRFVSNRCAESRGGLHSDRVANGRVLEVSRAGDGGGGRWDRSALCELQVLPAAGGLVCQLPPNTRMQLPGATVTSLDGRPAPGASIGNIDWCWRGRSARS